MLKDKQKLEKQLDELLINKNNILVCESKILTEDQIRHFGKDNLILYDIKYLLKDNKSDGRL